jgi:4-aminobutyrate aminotransferase-like enzyme
VFAIGRNHPTVREALKAVLDSELPNLVQMGVSVLSGVLAERLLGFVPHLDKVFFSNSGTEAVEAAIKFARTATRRPGIVYCSHAFHGLTYGSLSLNGDENFREGFGPFLPECFEIAFNDLAALEQALASRHNCGDCARESATYLPVRSLPVTAAILAMVCSSTPDDPFGIFRPDNSAADCHSMSAWDVRLRIKER